VAAAYVAFPDWLAVIEQVPAASTVTVVPLTVQMLAVFEAKVTVRPELAVALTVNGVTPRVTLLNGANVMVWVPETEKVWVTGVAAA
jgi:hypothetical protein